MNKYTKTQVVKAVRDQLPLNHLQRDDSVDKLLSAWFVTRRSDTGFQLTENGFGAMSAAEISHHDLVWDVSELLNKQQIPLILNSKLLCPFYILYKQYKDGIKYPHIIIRLYDERLAQWIELCDGLKHYLNKIDSYLHD